MTKKEHAHPSNSQGRKNAANIHAEEPVAFYPTTSEIMSTSLDEYFLISIVRSQR